MKSNSLYYENISPLNNSKIKNNIRDVVRGTSANRVNGLDLPFYTCEDCVKVKGKTPVWNAFDGRVTAEVLMNHALLQDQKLLLTLKLRNLKAISGAFETTGLSTPINH